MEQKYNEWKNVNIDENIKRRGITEAWKVKKDIDGCLYQKSLDNIPRNLNFVRFILRWFNVTSDTYCFLGQPDDYKATTDSATTK